MADYVLDKGYPVLSTYNSSSANGVQKYRCVKITTTGIDLQAVATAGNIAYVVMEDIDAVKVATGKTVANVRMVGVAPVFVAASGTAPTLGNRCMAGTGGGVVAATGATAQVLGIVVGATSLNQTIANGDLIYVLLTPGTQFGA